MYLKEMTLKNFRNYRDVNLVFSPQINVLIGENAQGKTNLLEAIYVLAMARSHRTNNERELVNFAKDEALIQGILERKLSKLKLELFLGKKGKKAKVNHLEQAKLSQYIGQMNVILFAPEDLALVKGSPAVRRKFIDMEFGQIDAHYLYNLSQYRVLLKQRNHYLKQLQLKKAKDLVLLEVLSDQIAAFGAEIIAKRIIFLDELEKYAQGVQAQITGQKEELKFNYDTSVENIYEKDVKQLYTDLKKLYETNQNKEIFQGSTLYGPHRDDVQFLINKKNVQVFGSQGQQRTTALAVKLAEIDVMKNETGEYPILLLDDVLSELDGARQTQLLRAIQDRVQTFLTTPSMSEVTRKLIKDPKVFRIEAGNIKNEEFR
ncbi:DNA replication/repair protein RecF [Liquorilactobacillus hordei]|uniref:DNA replication and repair protein RecF n=1 Tax=Liquorilactobacillus hordei DSM 19519 TaxID=1423759 RepID=A0A0R1ME36_9LACO|nr:DNA replication/repair protein RecF [Liquorilactobacillus hordei]KRL06350.1 recombination protein F [Liquorilactobacillus hordei DSM 19519]QYH51452.1 DNA replication/repair protein RecF [Liquorilactobacillus hordei DSM 19519]